MLPPGSIIGIMGGGQLGRMLAIAAAELGYKAHIYCPDADCPAAVVAYKHTRAGYEDVSALEAFAREVDVITLEFENIPVAGLKAIASKVPVRPGVEVLSICQHRIREKTAVNALGVATAPFHAVRGLADLEEGVRRLGVPCILKTAEMGYDGKGQFKLERAEQAAEAWAAVGQREAVLEGFVRFSKELSVIVARSSVGEVRCFGAVENIHRHHILHQTIAPARVSAEVAAKAEELAARIAEGLGAVGVLAIEMFLAEDGELLVNELAPRPHNSGHWTLDACITSQFEQAVRAVCGLPLGSVEPLASAVMTNLIGDEVEQWAALLANPRAKLHLYGKAEARPGRKMGHVTVVGA